MPIDKLAITRQVVQAGELLSMSTCNVKRTSFSSKGMHNETEGKVLTEILSDVQQDSRGSSVQLVKQRAETEEEQSSHAETITSQGES